MLRQQSRRNSNALHWKVKLLKAVMATDSTVCPHPQKSQRQNCDTQRNVAIYLSQYSNTTQYFYFFRENINFVRKT